MPAERGAPLQLALLGCGVVATRHARTLGKFGSQVVCSFASRDPRPAEALRLQFGGRAYGSYEAALDDQRIDAVLVATPTSSHLPLALAALRAGKHVIVEKPAFLRSGDCDVAAELAAGCGRQLLVAENYCYKPLVRTLRDVIASGAIGEVRYLTVNALKRQRTIGWRNDVVVAGGGALFEGGIHWIHLLGGLGLTIDSVDGYRAGDPDALERNMLVVARYVEGAVGTLHHAWDAPSLLHGLRLSRIYGTAGSIAFESNGLLVLVANRRPRLLFPGFRDIGGYRAMFADFLAAIRTGREPIMTLERARRDLELVEAAYQSADRHLSEVA